MKTLRAVLIVAFTTALTLTAASAFTEERFLDFVHRLQERGYGEMAVEFLVRLSKLVDLGVEVREVLELEMGNSLRISADEAANADQLQQRLAEAQTHLDKFLKENGDHPEAPTALGSLGDIASQRGQFLIKLARAATDQAKKDDYFKNARTALEDARPRFAQSIERYQARLAELAPTPAAPSKKETPKKGEPKVVQKKTRQPTSKMRQEAAAERQETEIDWLEARMKLALVDYYVAQTFSDPTDATRKAALQKAAKAFDSVYQQFRIGTMHEVGLYAHMWHGKSAEELGDLRLAEDIYDEVLVNAPEGGPQAPTGLEPLFAQVEYFRLLILQKQGKLQEFVAEATEWLRMKKLSSGKTSGYQGVALELAKAQIAQAEKSAGDERRRLFTVSVRSLADIAKVPSDYQQEAILLRRKYQEEVKGAPTEIASFDEGMSVGDAAAVGGQWDEAVTAYARAVELGAKEKDTQRVVDARFRLARAQYFSGKVADAANNAEEIARKNVVSSSAPPAAALAVNAALTLYAGAQDKKTALERLTQIANYTIERWPERPESDDARIALGQANIVRGDLEGAIAVFEAVNPKSERYPLALHYAGQAYWRGYLTEKQKPEASRRPEIRNLRDKAVERITASLDGQRKAQKEGQPLPRQLMDTQLLMGEVALEGGQADQAVPLLQPLLDLVKASKPQTLDLTTLRTLVAALRAYIATGDLAKASEVQAVVLEIGGDTPQVNSVLIEFAKLLGNEEKRAEAAAIEASQGTDTKAAETAEVNLKGTKEVFSKLLEQLASRQEHTLASMVYIGDSFAKLGINEKAREQYQRILKVAEEKPDIVPANTGAGALTRVRAQLVGLLRNEGKFPEAMQEVEQLIKANPKALEPLMEKGRILQSWAESEPKHFDSAVNHWTTLRTTLSRIQRKPPEYYEVIYNAASCLLAQGKRTSDNKKALQAEQLLKSTRVLSPNLSGPDMVAKYDALLDEAMKAQGRSPQGASK